MDTAPGNDIPRTFSLRRLLIPVAALFCLFACIYLGFFIGVREELPVPFGARSVALGAADVAAIREAWPESGTLTDPVYSFYVSPDSPPTLRDEVRAALTKRQWTFGPTATAPAISGIAATFSATKDKRRLLAAFGQPAAAATAFGQLVAHNVPQNQNYYIVVETGQ